MPCSAIGLFCHSLPTEDTLNKKVKTVSVEQSLICGLTSAFTFKSNSTKGKILLCHYKIVLYSNVIILPTWGFFKLTWSALVQSCQFTVTLQHNKLKQEEAKQTNFNVVLFIFWHCLNNYLADVVSMAAITPDRRALHYQWVQQSVPCLRWGDNTQTLNSVNQPLGFLSNGKDSQIKSSMFCMPVTVCQTGESSSPSKANTGADGVVYSAIYFVWWVHVLFWLRDHLLCVMVNHLFWTLIFRGWWDIFSVFKGHWFLLEINSQAGYTNQAADYSTGAIKPQLDFVLTFKSGRTTQNFTTQDEHKYCLFLPPFSSTACGKGKRLSPASSNMAPLKVTGIPLSTVGASSSLIGLWTVKLGVVNDHHSGLTDLWLNRGTNLRCSFWTEIQSSDH